VNLLIAGIAGLCGLGLLVMTIRRPAFGCAALILLVPLTAGLARGAVVPVLKPSEAILLVVLAGVVVHDMVVRRTRSVTALDMAIGAYVIGSVVIPWMVLTLTHYPADIDTWRTVLSPALLFAVYYLFARATLPDGTVRTFLNLAMLAGVIVSLVAAAELVNVPGVRAIVGANFPSPAVTPFRPGSTLGHYSAVGAFGAFTYIIALALATVRAPGYPRWWLTCVMGAGVLGVLASETWATTVAIPVATVLILIYGRRVPRELVVTVIAGGLALVVLWPLIGARADSQQLITAQGLALPESMQTRIRYWGEFIIPALTPHLWIGTGTVIPSTVPERLSTFVDNEYLWAAFRAGVAGVALLLGMLVAIIAAGWRLRSSLDPGRRAVGAASMSVAVVILLLGTTAQYITFAGLSQEFAMLVGVLAALTLRDVRRTAPVVVISAAKPPRLPLPKPVSAVLNLRRLKPESGLVRSSAVVFVGFATARALGFLFSIAAARILVPLDFGRLTYALAIVTIASVFIAGSPNGMSRFLARNHEERSLQESYYSNWIALIALIVIASVVVVIPISLLIGLNGWMLVGVLCNLVGLAVLETYREIQRGLDRYAAMMVMYVIANLAQLAGILVLGILGIRSAELFLIVYGLSGIAALAVMQPLAPIALRFVKEGLSVARMLEIFRFVRPLLIESVFFAVWFGSDLIMVQHLLPAEATGNYGAAKAFVNVLLLAPTAIGIAILPRIARLGERSVGRYIGAAMGLTAAVTLPLVAGAALLGPPLVKMLFGSKYPDAATPLAMLAVGMGLYGFYSVLVSVWIGLGRPVIDPVATGLGMVCTVAFGLVLIPQMGLAGAALAFTMGAALRLAVIAGFTLWALATWPADRSDRAAGDQRGLQPQTSAGD
jgi:O-antigen/teichoic acid export membrane protein